MPATGAVRAARGLAPEAGLYRLCTGLEAKRKASDDFAALRGADVLARFTEVESGRENERPELAKTLTFAKLNGATLVIDRLSRTAAFLPTLRQSGVRFLACDMPEANDLSLVLWLSLRSRSAARSPRGRRRRW